MRLLALILIITFCFSALSVMAAGVGSLHPYHPVVVQMNSCTLPCWNGITPGLTTRSEVDAILNRTGYQIANQRLGPHIMIYNAREAQAFCEIEVFYRQDFVDLLGIRSCSRVAVGEVMALLGKPEGIFFGKGRGVLVYSHGKIRLEARDWTSPFSPISSILIFHQESRGRIWPWRGFMPRWRYCQLEMVCYRL